MIPLKHVTHRAETKNMVIETMFKLLRGIVVTQLLTNMLYKRNQNIDSEFFSISSCQFERISYQGLERADLLTPQLLLLYQTNPLPWEAQTL